MKQPSLTDTAVKVRAYLTDEAFGYKHWRAAQFSAPTTHNNKFGLLLLFDTEAERDRAAARGGSGAPDEQDVTRRADDALGLRGDGLTGELPAGAAGDPARRVATTRHPEGAAQVSQESGRRSAGACRQVEAEVAPPRTGGLRALIEKWRAEAVKRRMTATPPYREQLLLGRVYALEDCADELAAALVPREAAPHQEPEP